MGLTLIRSTRDFEKALGKWNKKSIGTKTWATFKTHFKDTQVKLKEIRGPTMQQAGFHHANMLTNRLRADLHLQGTEMLAIVQELAISDNHSPTNEAQPSPQPVENAVVQDNSQLEMLRLLREISEERRGGPGGRGRGSGRGNGDRNRYCCTPNNANLARRITNYYCYTHEGCNHTPVDCTHKAPDHRDDATR